MQGLVWEYPVMKLGDKNDWRSVDIEQLDKDERVFTREKSTELWCEVYLPSSRWTVQLETTYWRVSAFRQEHADDCEMVHVLRFSW